MTRDEICSKFIDSVPHALYPFQEEAILAWFESPAGILVCAPTGMGKTLIAEAAIFEALHSRRRLYYTTPLIALTDQKYREIQQQAEAWGFSALDVGLITGNRKENPDALVRVVVAEILLNHLLANDPDIAGLTDAGGVVMDEFHSFNDPERGIVWELALTMLPPHVRVMLLSATVGNPFEFGDWLKREHQRELTLVLTNERRVPLEFKWIDDRLLTEQLPAMVEEDRTPALVFCFNRDECWEVAERLKGLPLVRESDRKEIEKILESFADDLREGVGPKLRQMLARGVGVHHAGVLPRHKYIVEQLFLSKLVPFCVCTETLAAGINLPARSVVLSTLLKGPPREKKLIPASSAHQMFGRAGRPQFDTQGYVYAVAHDDDVKIRKWRERFDKIDPNSKDPGIMRMRKEMERKRPTRRSTEQYWTEGQFRALIEAGSAKLASRSMIPYSVLIFLLTRDPALRGIRAFLAKRFNTPERLEAFQNQLEFMLNNLAVLGYLKRESPPPAPAAAANEPSLLQRALAGESPFAARGARPGETSAPSPPRNPDERVSLNDSIYRLLNFRSIDPLFGAYLAEVLVRGSDTEKLLALEGALEMPFPIVRRSPIPYDIERGPLQTHEIEPLLIQLGVALGNERDEGSADGGESGVEARPTYEDRRHDWLARDPAERRRPLTFPEMLQLAFLSKLSSPEEIFVQPKWIAGGAFRDFECDFFKYVKSCELVKQEGLILRHLLRLAILAGEFFAFSEDPAYQEIAESSVRTCQRVDEQYTAHFLSDATALLDDALRAIRK